MNIQEPIRKAYELGSSNLIKDTGNQHHDAIHHCFKEAEQMKWPPNAPDLQKCSKIPKELETLLSHAITKQSIPKTTKNQRLIFSIWQDICRAVAGGEWKLQKHLLLSMTLLHLYRSEQLKTLVIRMEHCKNYSYTLEMETGLALAIE